MTLTRPMSGDISAQAEKWPMKEFSVSQLTSTWGGKNQKRYRQIQNGSVKTGTLKLMQFSTTLKFHCDARWVALLLRTLILSEIPWNH